MEASTAPITQEDSDGSEPVVRAIELIEASEAETSLLVDNAELGLFFETLLERDSISERELQEAIESFDLDDEQAVELQARLEQAEVKVISTEEDSDDSKPLKNYGAFSVDSLSLYLRKIGEHPLLTAEEEVLYAKQMEAGLEAEEILSRLIELNVDWMSSETVLGLQTQIDTGRLAKKTMVESNLRLVVSIAKRYRNPRVPLLDRVQEGTFGLIRATEKFDWRKGFKFSTYATWWIRQAITRGIADKADTIRKPVHIFENIHKVTAAERRLTSELGREPTPEEIADDIDAANIPADTVRELIYYRSTQNLTSLDKPVGDDGDGVYGDMLKADQDSVEDIVIEDSRAGMVAEVLSKLNERERAIIVLRYGLNGGDPCTLEEIGKQLGLTRERVRQIENNSLNRLNGLPEAQTLKNSI